MGEDVFSNLKNWAKSKEMNIEVRKQRVSSGIMIKYRNQEINIDVVPAKRTNNIFKQEYNLHERNRNRFESKGRIKINPKLQNQINESKESVRDVIRLMRQYNKKIGKPMKSVLIDTLTNRAFTYNKSSIPRRLDEKFLMVMKFFSENIETAKITAIDNTNSILTESISWQKKQSIVYRLLNDIHKLESGKVNFYDVLC